MKARIFSLFLLLNLFFSLFAQIPEGYYDGAKEKHDEELKTALYLIIDDHTVLSYNKLWEAFKYTDKRPDGKVWDIYSGTTNYEFGTDQGKVFHKEGDSYNREHSFPKSWADEDPVMYTDLFHIYPADGYLNSNRSTLPYGETNEPTFTSAGGFSKKGNCSFIGYTKKVFEPNDEYKGDLARTYFYMVTRYENKISSWKSVHLSGNTYPGLSSWSVNLFLKWHRQDPVSQKEIDRNNVIYTKYQHNRNPFIDHPELAEYIWGNRKNQNWTGSNVPTILEPKTNTTLDFGNISAEKITNKTIRIAGQYLSDNVTVTITGTDADSFMFSTNSISKENAEQGYDLIVSCNPSTLGSKNAELKITSTGSNSVIVSLSANVIDDFVALEEENTTVDSFVANWTKSFNATEYLLNVYTKENTNSTNVILEEDFKNGRPDNWKKEGYISKDSKEPNTLKFASTNTNGVLTTPSLDLSNGGILTFRAKQYGNDVGASVFVDVDGEPMTSFATSEEYQIFTVEIPTQTEHSTISFRANKNSRFYLDFVKVEKKVTIVSKMSIQDYPKNVGNRTSYTVSGLEADKKYYYTVTPQGNSTLESNEIEVKTQKKTQTDIDYIVNNSVFDNTNIYIKDKVLYIEKIPEQTLIDIFDISGKKIFSTNQSNQIKTNLKNQGVYILKLKKDKIIYVQKIIN